MKSFRFTISTITEPPNDETMATINLEQRETMQATIGLKQ